MPLSTFSPCARLALLLSALVHVSLAQSAPEAEAPQKPWRFTDALNLPAWLHLSGTHRSRYETLDGQFRAGRDGGDQMLALRTTMRADLDLETVAVVGELMDARQALADRGTPIETGMVNTLELLQAYAAFRLGGPRDGSLEFRAGRQTLDLGSRSLVARNRFRNTMNAFTGLHGRWEVENRFLLQSFYFLPVVRQPSDPSSLLDNEIEFDEESFDLQFWGLHAEFPNLPLHGTGEIYLFGLHENDAPGRPTRNRELYTPGLRFSRGPAPGTWDFDIETALQFGETRGSTAPMDPQDLDHLAHFHHLEFGYTFPTSWSPRLAALYDYASGDNSPDDTDSNRFDTLFGSRRSDYGPTGIYGPFARANLNSPGYSIMANPVAHVTVDLTHRLFWLASDRDAWTTSGVRDPSGDSGSFIGQQIEARVRWDLLPGNVRLETGGAHLFAGKFIEEAPNATHRGDSTYGYLSLELRF